MTTYNDLERSDVAFWGTQHATGGGRALTLADLQAVIDKPAAEAPTVFVTSIAMLEGAGRGMGWPALDAHFEAIARGAAHAIFGNIALDVRQAVTARAAGEYVLVGRWPFPAATWSEPRQSWNED